MKSRVRNQPESESQRKGKKNQSRGNKQQKNFAYFQNYLILILILFKNKLNFISISVNLT